MARTRRKSETDDESFDLFREAEQISRTGSVDEAILLYKKALRFAGRKDAGARAKALRSLGNLCERKGEFRKALDYLEKGLSVSESAGDLAGVAHTYNCMGAMYFDSGKWSTVRKYFSRAMKAAEKSGDLKLIAHLHNNAGAMSNIRGDVDGALSSLKKAAQLYRELKDTRGLARVHNNLGLAYRDKGDWKKAAEHYEKCIRFSRKSADRSLWANCTLNYVQVLIELNRFTKARKKCDEALEVLIRMGEVAGIAEAITLYGMIFTREGKLALAERQFSESVMINENHGYLLGKAECFREMAAMYKEWENRRKTLTFLRKSSRLFRALRAETYLQDVEKQSAELGAA